MRRYRFLFTALIFLFLAFFFFTLHAREERQASIVAKVFLQISLPFQQKARDALSWVKRVGEHYIFLAQVQQENQELQRTVSALRQENNRLLESILAEERLNKLFSLQAQHSFPSMVAQVVARDPSNWFKTLLINKGEKDGVSKEMAVVASGGVVGRVIEISPGVAKVLLITDPNSAMDVIVQRSRSQGIMEGKVEEVCILKYVQKSDDVRVGDKLITSGMGGIFPKGLMVGTVTKVDRKRPGIFQYIEITPAVDLSKLEEVLIIKEGP